MKLEIIRVIKVSLLTLTLFSAILGGGQVSVLTHHNDNSRTGQNLNETVLNTSNVNQNSFGKLFWRTVDGYVYAQPLYVPGLSIQGTTRNVVYVATEHNSVYAFDADDPNAAAPLWQVNLGTPVPSQDICIITGDTNPGDCPYLDLNPEIGITGTPAIDPSAGIIYVVARTKNTSNNTYHYFLHALDLTSGIERLSGPVEIAGQVSGTGVGSQGGVVTFDATYVLQRPGLLLLNGVLYIAFGSVGDIGPYDGWVVSYNASTLQKIGILSIAPDGCCGGVWSAGQGLVGDGANNVYLITSDGDFNANTPGGRNYGDSYLKLSGSGLTVTDYFTPFNQANLFANNTDLGSGGPMLLPGTSLLVGMGKDRIFRVVDSNNMGHFNSFIDNDVQEFTATTGPFFSSPVYWNSPNNGPVVYLWGPGDFLKAFKFTGSLFQTSPVSQSTVQNSSGFSNAAALSLSASGNQAGTGIVWSLASLSGVATGPAVPGVVRAFDATDLTRELWNSTQNLTRDDVGNYGKYNPPTVANGKVYVGSFSGQLQVYGLNPPASSAIRFVQVAAATPQSPTATVNVTYPGPQSAGNLNVVIVGWNDSTSSVVSVTDSVGNNYLPATTVVTGAALRQSIYYAKNIAGGSNNSVTVLFNQGATKPDVRILEYSGVDTANPLDVATGASGNSNISDSGFVTTTAANELIVGASTIHSNTTIVAGAPFAGRVITSPDSDLAADRVVNVPGSYHAWAPLGATGAWVMQVVTFRAVSQSTAPTVSGVSPNNGPAAGGTGVTITGTNFVSGATVTFGGTAATNVVVTNSTTITATTPAHAAGAVTVTVTNPDTQSGSLANGFTYFTPGTPTVSSVAPNNGPAAGGTAVTITGTNFAAGATVTFGGTAATNVVVTNSTTITATTPAHAAGAVTVTVTVSGQSGSLNNGYTYNATVAISFAQVASATPQSPTATVAVAYPGAQTTGDLNVVVVGWNDTTATVQSVKDSGNNNYSLAIGPTSGTGLRQSIYYAANIVGGSNTVTVTFNQAAAFPDIRILEYRGVTALDVTAGASGNSTAANSGAATTTSANELIFGANMVSTLTGAAGSGFTARIITSPDSDLAEDKVVTTAGSNSATSTLNGAGPWVMQMVTFAAVSGPVPTVSSVSPNNGPTAGGTAVTITGTNFAAGAGVTFGGTAATNVAVANGTTITATTPAGSAGAVTVVVTNSSGQSGSLANGYTYIAPPTVSSVSPNNGPVAGGTGVTITGTNFVAGATVTLGGTAATNVAVTNGTTITATTPAHAAGAVTVVVTNPDTQSGNLANGFTYVATPTVSSVAPNTGSTGGGTAVTITGTNFVSGATVTFGGTAATNVAVTNSTTITATTPAHAAGAVTVTVTFSGQSGSLNNGFTYVVAPTVSSVAPNNGPVAGGTGVTITGTNFVAGATVTFGGTAASNVAVTNSTTITATTPAHAAGAVTVTVTNPDTQSGNLANGFTYVATPTVSSVAPNTGSTGGGTAVTITGTNFVSGATVTFGGTAATNVVVTNGTTITATTPAHGAGAVTVTVTVSGQSGSLNNGFTYVLAPTVSSVSPNNGPAAGGTGVTITGTNFVSGATVTFGGTAATNVAVTNGTTITATTPAHAAGAVTVTVTNPDTQSGNLANGFTYVATPTVSSVAPNNGPAAGGTAVTITGTNFVSGATVTFGGTAATNVVVTNSTTITATTPAHAAGAVTVTVTVSGQSGSLNNGYTYNATVAISFAQVASATPQSPTATVAVAYPGAQTTGDLNVVVVGWNDTTATVQSVKDSGNNNYSLAIGPTSGTGLRQSIYYAANIVGGSNTVTVTFNQAAAFPDIRILEYRGVTALDVTAGASGNSTAANSGAATTTSANELIFGANMVSTLTGAAGSGFTARIITSPDSDLAEDKVVTTAGSNSATSTLNGAGPWVMQMVTFAAVSGPVPTVSSVSPNNGPTAGGTAVTITGTNFAAGAGVTFGGTAATNVAVTNGTTITATTPAGSAGAVTVVVTNSSGQSGSLANGYTYIAPPTVSSVSPNNGPVAGGTGVTITGTNFVAGATVTLGGTAATNVAVTNGTTITATTPAHAAGAVTVVVTNPDTQSGNLANGFTYVATPTVSSVAPNTGSTGGGTAVTITGTNFVSGATVTFGGTAATNVAVTNSTTITATTPAHAAGAVTVTVTVSGQSGSLTNGFTYVVAPTVSSVAPNNGPVAGGTAVTITGTNFVSGATATFGGTAATNVVVTNSTTITATTPAHAAGAVTVTVTNPNTQSGSLANGFTYNAAPTVSNVVPNNGPAAGGTAVTITGTNFAAGATVTFGGTAATNVVVTNSTTITATTPAHAAGAVTVVVTNPDTQSGNLANGFTYNPAPTVSSVSPNTGSTAGGTGVTITGTNFLAGATVTFGGTAATNVAVTNSTTITATTPAHAAGAVTVTVTVSGQSGSLNNGFTYVLAPSVSSVAPNNGPVAGGTAVTITGTNFVSGATVTFGGTAATNVAVTNGTTITATTPPHAAGAVTVVVTNPDTQSGNLANGFTYVATPTVSSVVPNTGSTAGGTAVTITGTNFVSGATVTFGGTAATNVAVTNGTTITATTPAHAAGAVTVTVTVSGQSGSLTNGFTYVVAPTVSSVAPNNGPVAGGTAVTITGTNFVSGATATFGGTAATNVVVTNSTTITATTPAHAAGAVTVTVTNPNTQSGSLANGFTYNATLAISFVQVAAATPQSPAATVSVSYPVAQTPGDLNIVVVGWNDTTATVQSVKDSGGNNYSLAIGPTSGTGLRQSIYYLSNIAGGNNTVTVTFSLPAAFPDVRILEYQGVTALDVTAGASGNSTTANSGAATTSLANELIFGANMVSTLTGAAGSGFTARIITSPDSDLAEDKVVTTAGSNSATSTLNGSGPWVMQMATFGTPAGGGTPTAPTLTAAGGGPGPTVASVQSYINSNLLTSHTTAAFDSTGGDLIVMCASSHAGVTLTPSDNFGNNWISIAGPTNTSVGFDLRSQVWYAGSPIVGPGHTVTMGLSAAQSLVISIFVIKGSNVSSPIDAISLIGSDNGTQTVNVVSPSINIASTNDLLIGFSKVSAGAVFQAGTGFTLQPAASSNFLAAETGSAANPGSYNARFTLDQPQTWQSAVVAAANTPNQASLSWTASTEPGGIIRDYFVERCQGAGCSSFAQIGRTPDTTFNDTSLTASTVYSYRVRAEDTANTLGPYSNVATVTIPAPIPSLPGNLTATAVSGTQVNLSWVSSTETGGTISSYLVERCQGANCTSFAQIGTATITTFSDTGLTGSTSYSYRVRASDTGGRLSPYSNVASATTQ